MIQNKSLSIYEMDAATEDIPAILVTGFGPFGKHVENASQKVVEKLQTLDIEETLKVKLHTKILEVAYLHVLEHVPECWDTLKPKLVVHIGVSEYARDIVLEQQAFNSEFIQPDIKLCAPPSKQCLKGYPTAIQSSLDLLKAVRETQEKVPDPVKFSISCDPGRFLCTFVYYLSLSINKDRSMFIHVPPLCWINENPDTAASRLAESIAALIKCLYAQVKDKPNVNFTELKAVIDKIKNQQLAKGAK